MAISDTQYAAWLRSPTAARCVLVEVTVKSSGVNVTRYLSNKVYVTSPSDSPSNTSYIPRIAGGIEFTKSISTDGSVTISYGDVQLNNQDGYLDSWVNDIWMNKTINIYVGDVSWARSDFRTVFTGLVNMITCKSRNSLNIVITDILSRLNSPMTETKVGGTGSNADNPIPLLFGECHNIEPVLYDNATLEYVVHDGPIEDIFEVRDNGVPVSYTKYLSTGRFRLTNKPVGTVTCSAQGDKPSGTYYNDIGNTVKNIITRYGPANSRVKSSEVSNTEFNTFIAANVQPIGVYVRDRVNVLELVNGIANSIGARLYVTSAGKVSILQFTLPASGSGTSVGTSDIQSKSLEITDLTQPVAGVKVGYCKNWTVQTALQTGLPANHISLYNKEWLTSTIINSTIAQDYLTYTEPSQIDTYLLTSVDASAEATRRFNMWSVQRKRIKYTGFSTLFAENLLGTQTITYPRFGLNSGVSGVIVSISVDWTSPLMKFEVLI